MRDYEILYIVRPDLDEDQVNQAVERVNALISNVGGAAARTDVWGKRRLAYEVDHLREGYYVLTDFQIEPERVPELESTLRISDTVFRHLIVRKPAQAAASVAPPQEAPAAEAPAAEPEAPAAESAAEPAEAPAEAEEAAPEASETAEPAEAQPAAEAETTAEEDAG